MKNKLYILGTIAYLMCSFVIAEVIETEQFTFTNKVYIGASLTAGTTNKTANSNGVALKVVGNIEADEIYVGGSSDKVNGATYTPYQVISSYSNGILLENGNYQKIVCTNNVGTNYFDIPATNKSAYLLLEVDKGTNSLSFYTDNLTTNGLGSINSITLTNSGITSIQFYFPCAGTNLGLKWKAYQF